MTRLICGFLMASLAACTVTSVPPPRNSQPTYTQNDPPQPPPPDNGQPPPRDHGDHGDHRPPPPGNPPSDGPRDHEPPRNTGPAWDSTGWRMLGEKVVGDGVDHDQVDFSQKQGTASRLTIVVLDSDLEMIDMTIVFVSGKTYNPNVKQFFRENTRTRAIDLPSSDILRAVQFTYRNVARGGTARVQVWAKS